MRYQNWRLPPFLYFVFAALCLGGAGEGCEYFSRTLPAGNATAPSVGVSCGFILLAVVLCVKGIFNWED